MAVQQITHKKITKFDTSNPNYKETPIPKQEVNGNVKDDEDVYGERKHTYTPEPNGNLQMEQMMGKLMNKLDNFEYCTSILSLIIDLLLNNLMLKILKSYTNHSKS